MKKFSLKFEDYRRAAVGDLPYIADLLSINPGLINMPMVFMHDAMSSAYLMRWLTAYSSLELGNYYRLAKDWTSDWGHYFLGGGFDTLAYYIRTLIPTLTIGELIFSSTELAAMLTIRHQKQYIANHEGWTLLDFAVENGQSDIALYLISNGASLDANRLFDIFKANGHGRRFLISLTQGIKDRADKERLKNNNTILQKNLEEVLDYAERLLKEHEQEPVKHKKKSVKYTKKHTGLYDDTLWYDDEHINTLLKFYFPITQSNIRALPALEWNANSSDIHTFIQTRFTNAIGYHPDCFIYFLPLQINKNHWIGLYVDRTAQHECIWWMDPMGGMTEAWKNKIVEILNDAQIFATDLDTTYVHVQAVRLQHDTFNCGPWVIELLRFFTANKRFSVVGEINIGTKRQEHLAILNGNQPAITTQLQGISGQLGTFGVFDGQPPVVAIEQNAQIYKANC